MSELSQRSIARFCQLVRSCQFQTNRSCGIWDSPPGARTLHTTREHWCLIGHAGGADSLLELRHADGTAALAPGSLCLLPPARSYAQILHADERQSVLSMQIEVIAGPGPWRPFELLSPLVAVPLADAAAWQRSCDRLRGLEQRVVSNPKDGGLTPQAILVANVICLDLITRYLLDGFAAGLLHLRRAPMPEWVAQAQAYLDEHFRDPDCRISAVAAHCGYAQRSLEAAFHRHFQQSPSEYLHHQRMLAARRMLLGQPDLSLVAIAKRCGYRSRSAFFRMFTKLAGEAPSAFREGSDA